MQASIFENLEHVRPAAKYPLAVSRRIKILENTVRELRKYHDKAGKNKRPVIMRLIVRYEECITRLSLI